MSKAVELLKGSVTRVSQTLVSILVAFVMMPFLVHELGNHWYGVWTVVGGLAGAYHLFDIGMTGAVTRYVSRSISRNDERGANEVISTSFVIYLALAAVLALVSLLISFSFPYFLDIRDHETVQILIVIVGVSVALEFPFNAFAGIASAQLKFHQVALARIFVTLLGAGLTLYFISHGYGIVALAVISFVTSRISNLLYWVICRFAFPALKLRFSSASKGWAKELFSYSIWSFVIAITYQLRNNVDNLVVASYLSAATVTHYAIGLRLVDYLAQFLSQATNMFIPIFTGYHANQDHRELHEKLLFITRLNTVVAMIAGAGLIIFGMAFIRIWMGSDYTDAYGVMVILLIGRMIGFINHPLNSALYAANRHRIIAKLDVIEVILNLILSVLLVQYYGMLGVAAGTAIPLLLLRVFCLPFVACKAIGMSAQAYYLCLVRPMTVTLVTLGPIYFYVESAIVLRNYMDIILYGVAMAMIGAVAALKLSFSDKEKTELRKLIPSNKLKRLL